MRSRHDITYSKTPPDLSGKRVAIVGGTGGLGRAIAQLLARRGAKVTVVGQTFRDEGVAGLTFVKADLSLMKEARRVGALLAEKPPDVTLLTTGIFAAPKRQETSEGLERDMAVSYLSRLEIVRALGPKLLNGQRVFVMGYPGSDQKPALDDLNAEKNYAPVPVHMATVAGNEALVLDAQKRYPAGRFFGLNPGLIKTNIRDNFLGAGSMKSRLAEWLIGLLNMSPERYAEVTLPLLFAQELDGHGGAMFNQKARPIHQSTTMTPDFVSALLSASEALTARVN